MQKRDILIVAFFVAAFSSFGQQHVLDSIKSRIKIETNDSEKVRLLVQLGNKSKLTDTLESWRCFNAIDSIASVTHNSYFAAQADFLHGTICVNLRKFEALNFLDKAIVGYAAFPDNKRAQLSLGAALINTGLIYYTSGDCATAVDFFLRAEQIYFRFNPLSTDMAVLYSNMSMAYSTLNKPEEALRISKKGYDFAKRINDKQILASAYYTYGGNLVAAKKGNSGLAVLDSAKLLANEVGNQNVIYMSDFMKAMYYYNNKLYQQAIDYYTTCLQQALASHFAVGIGSNYLNIAACEAELKMTSQAATHLDSSARYLDYSNPSEAKMQYFENYAQVYRLMGKYDKAFAFKDSAVSIKDSLYQQDNLRQMEFRQARYNYDAKQQEVNKLEAQQKLQQLEVSRKNTLNYLLGCSAAALMIISFMGYRNFKQKQKMQQRRITELETEKQLTATEAVLKGEEQERVRMAKDLHDGLGGMLSGIKYSFNNMKGNLVMTPENTLAFERGMDMLDSSIKEMRRVAHNMMPEALVKFGLDIALKDFCAEINQSGALKINYQSIGLENASIDQTIAITIYRIVQELINNTMKHASAKNAIVQVTKSNGQLAVTVEDDGKGFNPEILSRARGIGWTNIQSRVDFLKGKLDIDAREGKGTSVLIELNI